MALHQVAPLFAAVLFAGAAHPAAAAGLRQGAEMYMEKTNPIKKVVTLMQDMQKEVEAQGKKEKELFDKFMCYCSQSGSELQKSVDDAKEKAQQLAEKLVQLKAEKLQTNQELAGHKTDRAGAEKDLAEAQAIREKEAAECAKMSGDLKANIDSVGSATEAIEKSGGAGASFLQMPAVVHLKRLVGGLRFDSQADREDVMSFLGVSSGDQEDAPASDQIVGILKSMKDTMEAELAKITEEEQSNLDNFASLEQSKNQEIKFASEAIEAKTERAGSLAVEVVETSDGQEDAAAEAEETEKFVQELEASCKTKQAEWDEREKMRGAEIEAISQAISTLTGDDAQATLSKATKGKDNSLLQIDDPALSLLQRSARPTKRARLAAAARRAAVGSPKGALALLELQLKTKLRAGVSSTVSSGGVEAVVEKMIVQLEKEAAADVKQSEFCTGEIGKAEAAKKASEETLNAKQEAMEKLRDDMASVQDGIDTTSAEVAEMDKAAVEATEQRKEEHEDYMETITDTDAAVELLGKAKNKLNKFYNPTMYVAEEENEEESLAQTHHRHRHRHRRHGVAPPPAPETFGAYEKSSGSTSILAMIDSIVRDLEKDRQEAEHSEKKAQEDYVELMNTTAENRAQSADDIVRMKVEKASMAKNLSGFKDDVELTDDELDGIKITLANVHGQCDGLMKDLEARKTKREGDIQGLKDALATLKAA